MEMLNPNGVGNQWPWHGSSWFLHKSHCPRCPSPSALLFLYLWVIVIVIPTTWLPLYFIFCPLRAYRRWLRGRAVGIVLGLIPSRELFAVSFYDLTVVSFLNLKPHFEVDWLSVVRKLECKLYRDMDWWELTWHQTKPISVTCELTKLSLLGNCAILHAVVFSTAHDCPLEDFQIFFWTGFYFTQDI